MYINIFLVAFLKNPSRASTSQCPHWLVGKPSNVFELVKKWEESYKVVSLQHPLARTARFQTHLKNNQKEFNHLCHDVFDLDVFEKNSHTIANDYGYNVSILRDLSYSDNYRVILVSTLTRNWCENILAKFTVTSDDTVVYVEGHSEEGLLHAYALNPGAPTVGRKLTDCFHEIGATATNRSRGWKLGHLKNTPKKMRAERNAYIKGRRRK